jgi:hypothetical protein
MPFPSDPLWLHHSNCIWRRVQVMKLLIMRFSPASYSFIPLGSKYFSRHPVLEPLSLYSSLNIRDKVSHPYKTTSRITVLLYFSFYVFKQQTRRQKFLNWMAASITRIQSALNFTTFWNVLPRSLVKVYRRFGIFSQFMLVLAGVLQCRSWRATQPDTENVRGLNLASVKLTAFQVTKLSS